MNALHVEVAESVDALRIHLDGWSRLADAVGAARGAPAWLLAWWHHARPSGAELRVAVVRDGHEVVAVAPYFVHRRGRRRVEYRPLGPGFADPVGVVAKPGTGREAGPLIAAALAGTGPRPDVVTFEGIDARSPWPEALRRAWPAAVRPTRYVTAWHPVPWITLDAPHFDAWLNRRSSSFRAEMRKKRRRVERAGGHTRAVPPGDAAHRTIAAFVRFHHDRFAAAGGSSLPVAGLATLLEEAADALIPSGRMRLFSVELDDEIIGVQVALAAAGVVHAWAVAFSPEQSRLSPGILATLAMVEDAFARGDRRLGLGSGAHPYKLRMADSVDAHAVLNGGFCVFSRRYPLTRLELLPAEARAVALRTAHTLSPEWQTRLRTMRQRLLALKSRSA
jgi:CelD/BcsL family acetyltransferase involved in cellulose biosynthesis